MYRINFYTKMMFSIFLLFLLAHFTHCNTEEDDIGFAICDGPEWVKFKDEKCYKLIKKWVPRSEAQEMCSTEVLQIDSSIPQLATIKTQEEQDYLVNYIFNTSEVMINVWIGAKRQASNQFVWDDGSEVKFVNWIEEGPSDRPERGCVEMQYQFARKHSDSAIINARENGGNGKWRDVTCGLPNYVVCEKLQRWSFGKLHHSFLVTRKQLKDSFELVSKELDDTNDKLKSTQNQLTVTQNQLSSTQNELNITQQNPVPIGFIYVQLPNQPEPESIWPMVEWSQVTSDYAGQFFRAEGGSSAAFGTIQEGDCPKLTNVEVQWLPWNQFGGAITLTPGVWSKFVRSGGGNYNNEHNALKFLSSKVEVRPRNQAVRIWKRSS